VLECKLSCTFRGQAALNHNGVGPLLHHGRKNGIEVLGSVYADGLNLNTRDTAGKLNLLENQLCECWICHVGENGHTPGRRHHVEEDLNELSMRFRRHHGQDGDIAAGASEAGDEAGSEWIARQEDDRNLARCLLRRQATGRVERHDDVDLEPDQLCRQAGKPIECFFRRTKLKQNILPLDGQAHEDPREAPSERIPHRRCL